MSRIINLDEWLDDPRQIEYQGKKYPVADLTVSEMLKVQALLERADEKGIEVVVEVVDMFVPDLKARQLPFKVVSRLFKELTGPEGPETEEEHSAKNG